MISFQLLSSDEGKPPAYSGTGVWLGRGKLGVDAGQNPVLLLRSVDGSIGGIICVDESGSGYGTRASELLEKAIKKFSLAGLEKNQLEAAVTGGADNAIWKVGKLSAVAVAASLTPKSYDQGGLYYRKIYFEPKSGKTGIFREKADPSDWNPAKAKLTIDSGTKGFSDGQAGGVVANATRFFREESTFTALRELVLMEHIRLTPDKPLMIWCAACSSGVEAYSYAMYIHHLFTKVKAKCSFAVYGTDINAKLIEKAKIGEYKVSQTDMDSYRPYFERYGTIDADKMSVRFGDEIQRHLSFGVFDIKNVPRRKGFRMIICANVFQYYEDDARAHFMRNFIGASLRPGYFFVKPMSVKAVSDFGLSELRRYRLFRAG